MKTKTIKLIDDFDSCPSGRYIHESDTSGQAFRENILRPALAENESIVIDLTGADSLPPSFLDESIGMLAKELGAEKFHERIHIILTDDETALRKLNESIEARSKECTIS